MTTFTIIFTIFTIYMTGCCMDGPDLKPRWRRWLGIKLEGYANQLKPIHYCQGICCGYYKLANETLPLYEKRYTQLIEEIAKTNALNSRPGIVVQNFDAVPVKSRVMIGEDEIWRAHMNQDMAKRHGIPEYQMPRRMSVQHLIEDAKEASINNLMKEASQFASVEIDEESYYPGIVVTASMMVGKKNNAIAL